MNPQPVATSGLGGLCYAASQTLDTKADKDAKKDTAQDEWGVVQPFCEPNVGNPCQPGNDDPNGFESKSVIGDWFALIGSNVRSCTGTWDQAFVYNEMIAYYGGAGTYENGYSGHVNFFVTGCGGRGLAGILQEVQGPYQSH